VFVFVVLSPLVALATGNPPIETPVGPPSTLPGPQGPPSDLPRPDVPVGDPQGEPKHPFCYSPTGVYLGICSPYSWFDCDIYSGSVWGGWVKC
jgi:hypothetical protein